MNQRQTATCFISLLFASLCGSACDEPAGVKPLAVSAPSATAGPTASTAAEEAAPKVETALELDQSAYGVELVVTASTWTLITAAGFYQQRGEAPAVHIAAPMTPPFALMSQSVLHWADGQLVKTPLSGTASTVLAPLERMPRDIFASTDHFAWLERAPGGDRIRVANERPVKGNKRDVHRTIYTTPHNIVSGAMLQDWVFFVEALPGDQWRLGSVATSRPGKAQKAGDGATLGAARSGRPPAFLLAEADLYFYDGPSRSVRRVTPDLQQETTIAKGVICSPLAVAEGLYCAQVGGVFGVETPNASQDASHVRAVDSQTRGPITAIGASATQVVWVEDLAGKQLRVRVARLP